MKDSMRSSSLFFGITLLAAHGTTFACGYFDPMRSNPAEPEAGIRARFEPIKPRISTNSNSVDCDRIGWDTFIDGIYFNTGTSAFEKVRVQGNTLRTRIEVCRLDACLPILQSLLDAANALASAGHRSAAQEIAKLNSLENAKKWAEKFEDPCIKPGEKADEYVARAQQECRDFVYERLDGFPIISWVVNRQMARLGCVSVLPRQAAKHLDSAQSGADVCNED